MVFRFKRTPGAAAMWIELSKALPHLVYPLSVALVLVLAGGVSALAGARRSGGWLAITAAVVLLAASNPLLAKRFRAALEQWYTPLAAADAPRAGAIVVLGGGLALPMPPRVGVELGDAADRVLHGARLYRAGKAPLVVATGGNVFDQGDGVLGEAHYMAALLAEWGVPPAAIIIEHGSRNTRDNALETKKILDRENIETILLVTSAMHMPRALATFLGAGVDAIPVPVDYTVSDYRRPLLLDLLPSAEALAFNTQTVREYLGILVYGVRGWLATAVAPRGVGVKQ